VTRLYGMDLVGASLGCLFVLGALAVLDVPSLILMCGAVGGLAGLAFGAEVLSRRSTRLSLGLVGSLVLVATLNAGVDNGIQPTVVKGRLVDPEDQLLQRWNSFSRVVLYRGSRRPPFYWGPSPSAPQPLLFQYYLNIDGEAGTSLGPFLAREDLDFLRYDVTNVAYYLRPRGGAGVIGVGGGRDVQSAVAFGHEAVTGIEVNPIFVELLTRDFAAFAGLAGRPGVRLVVDDARSYLSRSSERFRILQMSMIDTWAATGAGAYSLSENGLYTVEAWQVFLEHLTDDGIFTVSRWHNPEDLGETGRSMSLAVATLLDLGVSEPAAHVALVTSGRLATLLVARRAFTAGEAETLERVTRDLGFRAVVLPGRPPGHGVLRAVLAARTPAELARATAGTRLDLSPPTDDEPYFFNMLRLGELPGAWRILTGKVSGPGGVLRGNLIATTVLAGLI
ncbi:MAG TPA: hypothetical protein VE173_11625, partial [Longimicrobiales bacterium]|nr:hypothetical protein [Longimicrobiales bacterium]